MNPILQYIIAISANLHYSHQFQVFKITKIQPSIAQMLSVYAVKLRSTRIQIYLVFFQLSVLIFKILSFQLFKIVVKLPLSQFIF